jgi:hypothetical protein
MSDTVQAVPNAVSTLIRRHARVTRKYAAVVANHAAVVAKYSDLAVTLVTLSRRYKRLRQKMAALRRDNARLLTHNKKRLQDNAPWKNSPEFEKWQTRCRQEQCERDGGHLVADKKNGGVCTHCSAWVDAKRDCDFIVRLPDTYYHNPYHYAVNDGRYPW